MHPRNLLPPALLLVLHLAAGDTPRVDTSLPLCTVLPDATALSPYCELRPFSSRIDSTLTRFGRVLTPGMHVSAIALIARPELYLEAMGPYDPVTDKRARITPDSPIAALHFRRRFATSREATAYEATFMRQLRSAFSCAPEPIMPDEITMACRTRPGSTTLLHYMALTLSPSAQPALPYEFTVNVTMDVP